MLTVSIIVAVALGCAIGSVIYTVSVNSQQGCIATHAVIHNLNDYFESQIQRIESDRTAVSGQFAKHPALKARALQGYQRTIDALNHVRCN